MCHNCQLGQTPCRVMPSCQQQNMYNIRGIMNLQLIQQLLHLSTSVQTDHARHKRGHTHIDCSAKKPGDIEPSEVAANCHKTVEAPGPYQHCYQSPLGVDLVQHHTGCCLPNLYIRYSCSADCHWPTPAICCAAACAIPSETCTSLQDCYSHAWPWQRSCLDDCPPMTDADSHLNSLAFSVLRQLLSSSLWQP